MVNFFRLEQKYKDDATTLFKIIKQRLITSERDVSFTCTPKQSKMSIWFWGVNLPLTYNVSIYKNKKIMKKFVVIDNDVEPQITSIVDFINCQG